jgi:hypothetical protein
MGAHVESPYAASTEAGIEITKKLAIMQLEMRKVKEAGAFPTASLDLKEID